MNSPLLYLEKMVEELGFHSFNGNKGDRSVGRDLSVFLNSTFFPKKYLSFQRFYSVAYMTNKIQYHIDILKAFSMYYYKDAYISVFFSFFFSVFSFTIMNNVAVLYEQAT